MPESVPDHASIGDYQLTARCRARGKLWFLEDWQPGDGR